MWTRSKTVHGDHASLETRSGTIHGDSHWVTVYCASRYPGGSGTVDMRWHRCRIAGIASRQQPRTVLGMPIYAALHCTMRAVVLRAQENGGVRWGMRKKGHGPVPYLRRIPEDSPSDTVRHMCAVAFASSRCPRKAKRWHDAISRKFPPFLRAPFRAFSSMEWQQSATNDWR